MQRQADTRWAAVVGDNEVIVLATQILKRRHLSVKRRHLLLCDCVDGCRLFYVDPDTMEVKGAIPWSPQLHAELMPRGQFRVHTPGRTYYLEEVVGDVECAELWVKTITKLQARLAARGPRASNGGGGAASPGGTRGAPQMACRMSSSEARDA